MWKHYYIGSCFQPGEDPSRSPWWWKFKLRENSFPALAQTHAAAIHFLLSQRLGPGSGSGAINLNNAIKITTAKLELDVPTQLAVLCRLNIYTYTAVSMYLPKARKRLFQVKLKLSTSLMTDERWCHCWTTPECWRMSALMVENSPLVSYWVIMRCLTQLITNLSSYKCHHHMVVSIYFWQMNYSST